MNAYASYEPEGDTGLTEKSQDESTETLPAADDTLAASEHPASANRDEAIEPTPDLDPDQPADDSAPEPTDLERTEHEPDLESAPAEGPPAPSPAEKPTAAEAEAQRVRLSHPTPAKPVLDETSHTQAGLSSFFDNIDEKFMGATRRLTSAFRRPSAETPPQDHAGAAEQLPEPVAETAVEGPLTEKQVEAEPESAPESPSRHESPSALESPSAPESPAARPAAQKPVTAQDPERAPLSLPKPRRALDEQRQRDVILEKAAAIEAATAPNFRPTGREFVEFADDEEDLFTYIPPYNLPSRDPDPAPVRSDLYRQIFVSLGALAAVISMVWMFGAFTSGPAILGGNGLDTHSEGWYSGEFALLSPHANFYWLWPFIVLGLAAHAIYQWTTSQTATPRQRRSGWQVGSASLFMLIWTAAVHHSMLTLAALAALAAALALIDAIRQFTFRTARTSLERRLADTTTGLFAGWALVAGMSSLSIWLTAMGWRVPGIPAVIWALIGLGICIWAAAYYAMTERGRITLALGMGWGMFWLIFPRILSEVTSVWVAICAAMGAFVVILATESRRHKINHAERRAAMGRPLEDII